MKQNQGESSVVMTDENKYFMLTIGVLLFATGFIVVVFNTVNFRFVKDQDKNKKQAIAGFIIGIIGLALTLWAIRNLMLE